MGVDQTGFNPLLLLNRLNRQFVVFNQIFRIKNMEMKMIDTCTCSNTVVADPNLQFIYFTPGNILKIFRSNRRISDPTT